MACRIPIRFRRERGSGRAGGRWSRGVLLEDRSVPQTKNSIRRWRAPVNPKKGSQGRAVGGKSALRRALQPLFDPRAGHDVVPVAEAHLGPQGAVLVPKPVELRVQPVDVGHDACVVFSGEALVQVGALVAQTVYVLMDLLGSSHAL